MLNTYTHTKQEQILYEKVLGLQEPPTTNQHKKEENI